tara:strand:+ start:105 stop:377 length:273 start_codon:yes stop_codon:yes gene_type:complete
MAFKRWNKTPSKQLPKKSWSNEEMKIIGWCLNNEIKVGVSPDWKGGLNDWQIEITVNKSSHVDPNVYNDEVVYNKVNEYYKYYYDKYNKQ